MPRFFFAKCDRYLLILAKHILRAFAEIIAEKIYRRYIAPGTQFPYIDLVQASYCPVADWTMDKTAIEENL